MRTPRDAVNLSFIDTLTGLNIFLKLLKWSEKRYIVPNNNNK